MTIAKNQRIEGLHGKPILADVYFNYNNTPKPVVVFIHGFKGFKDWGHFDLLARTFADNGFAFVKFNFSHNGTTPENLHEIVDLDAFANNNFTKEMDDLGCVIDHVMADDNKEWQGEIDHERLCLMGHSRGGGITILKAAEDDRVKKLVTWASVNEFGKFWSEDFYEKWRQKGVTYIENARTGQQLPMYYQVYEDYNQNIDRLHIPTAVKNLDKPFLIIHGTDDPAVPYKWGWEMSKWNENTELLTIEGGDHTFGAKHPWEKEELPKNAAYVVNQSISFFKGEWN